MTTFIEELEITMTTHIKELEERLDQLEAHIEQRHREARHERKTLLQHIKVARLHLRQLRRQVDA